VSLTRGFRSYLAAGADFRYLRTTCRWGKNHNNTNEPSAFLKVENEDITSGREAKGEVISLLGGGSKR